MSFSRPLSSVPFSKSFFSTLSSTSITSHPSSMTLIAPLLLSTPSISFSSSSFSSSLSSPSPFPFTNSYSLSLSSGTHHLHSHSHSFSSPYSFSVFHSHHFCSYHSHPSPTPSTTSSASFPLSSFPPSSLSSSPSYYSHSLSPSSPFSLISHRTFLGPVGLTVAAVSFAAFLWARRTWAEMRAMRPDAQRDPIDPSKAEEKAHLFYDGGFDDEMTKKEAALILGCRESATKEKIMARYRILMKANHPDLGGSPYLSLKINEAKELLFKTARTENENGNSQSQATGGGGRK